MLSINSYCRSVGMSLALRLVSRNLLVPSCGSLSPLTYRAMASMKPMSAEVRYRYRIFQCCGA